MPSLVEKLAAIVKTVPQLQKEGFNEQGQYPFIRALDMFEAVRVKLADNGIVVLPLACKSERSNPYLSVTGDITDEWKVEITYRVTDGAESLDCCAHGVGQDHAGKALYIASTGAKKDLLKSIFLIAGIEDDAEFQQDTERVPPTIAEKLDELERVFGPDMREHPIDRIKVNAFGAATRKTGYAPKAVKAFLKSCGVDKITDLKRKDFDRAMKWALGESEVSLGEAAPSGESDTAE